MAELEPKCVGESCALYKEVAKHHPDQVDGLRGYCERRIGQIGVKNVGERCGAAAPSPYTEGGK